MQLTRATGIAGISTGTGVFLLHPSTPALVGIMIALNIICLLLFTGSVCRYVINMIRMKNA